MAHHRRTDCRVCGDADPEVFLRLGPQPLANAFPASPDEFADERTYPLDVAFCRGCSLVQTPDVIDPETLFRDYVYVSGTSDAMAAHFTAYAADVVRRLGLGADDLVVEVASNDGTLLKRFQAHGVRALGVEPAVNIAEMARAAGVETENVFFGLDTARALRERHGRARAVVANNVLAHVDDTLGFLRGCAELVADDGLVVVEVPYLGHLVERLEYDTIYHEHLCYFSVSALLRAFEAAGLAIVRVDHVPVHGGSIRVHGARRAAGHDGDVLALARGEADAGLTDPATYHAFAERVHANRDALRGLLLGLREEGRSIAAYGAPAKGNTLLNFCGIDSTLVAFTADKNPLKVGRYTPGTHVPVRPASALLEEQPDDVLILAWNFADEIMRQQAEYARRGGRFVLPVPEPRIVTPSAPSAPPEGRSP